MTQPPIPTAPPPQANTFKPSDQTGALVRFVVHAYDPNAATPFGSKAEVVVDVDVIESRHQQGEHFGPQRLSGTQLAPQLGQCVGREAYGRMMAQPGRNANPAMYLGELMSGDEATINSWRQWMGNRLVQPDPSAASRAAQQEPDPRYSPPTGQGYQQPYGQSDQQPYQPPYGHQAAPQQQTQPPWQPPPSQDPPAAPWYPPNPAPQPQPSAQPSAPSYGGPAQQTGPTPHGAQGPAPAWQPPTHGQPAPPAPAEDRPPY